MKNIFLTLAMSLTLLAYGQDVSTEPKVIFEAVKKSNIIMRGHSFRVRNIMKTAEQFEIDAYEEGTIISLSWKKEKANGKTSVLVKTLNTGSGQELYYYYIFE